eukprot:Blabericola_migrator_1__10770@NODE_617_length_7255_cov_83_500696_g450_i0_p2_GENE_NODE_617_length_7255_cov_83_500696_g450_i0NODE_617_length_7255_cov_83_500696_g450_i0_p2_ORF_typecomplete_len402_score56_71_NODE_617_length_7255_cov_83_500696_g450_i017572962
MTEVRLPPRAASTRPFKIRKIQVQVSLEPALNFSRLLELNNALPQLHTHGPAFDLAIIAPLLAALPDDCLICVTSFLNEKCRLGIPFLNELWLSWEPNCRPKSAKELVASLARLKRLRILDLTKLKPDNQLLWLVWKRFRKLQELSLRNWPLYSAAGLPDFRIDRLDLQDCHGNSRRITDYVNKWKPTTVWIQVKGSCDLGDTSTWVSVVCVHTALACLPAICEIPGLIELHVGGEKLCDVSERKLAETKIEKVTLKSVANPLWVLGCTASALKTLTLVDTPLPSAVETFRELQVLIIKSVKTLDPASLVDFVYTQSSIDTLIIEDCSVNIADVRGLPFQESRTLKLGCNVQSGCDANTLVAQLSRVMKVQVCRPTTLPSNPLSFPHPGYTLRRRPPCVHH